MTTRLADARTRLAEAEKAAAPYVSEVRTAEAHVERAEQDQTTARLTARLDELVRRPPSRVIDRGLGIEL